MPNVECFQHFFLCPNKNVPLHKMKKPTKSIDIKLYATIFYMLNNTYQ